MESKLESVTSILSHIDQSDVYVLLIAVPLLVLFALFRTWISAILTVMRWQYRPGYSGALNFPNTTWLRHPTEHFCRFKFWHQRPGFLRHWKFVSNRHAEISLAIGDSDSDYPTVKTKGLSAVRELDFEGRSLWKCAWRGAWKQSKGGRDWRNGRDSQRVNKGGKVPSGLWYQSGVERVRRNNRQES